MREIEEPRRAELNSGGGLNLGGAVGKGQNHVAGIELDALFGVFLASDETEGEVFHAVADLMKFFVGCAPEQHARVGGVCEVEFASSSVERSGDNGGQAE